MSSKISGQLRSQKAGGICASEDHRETNCIRRWKATPREVSARFLTQLSTVDGDRSDASDIIAFHNFELPRELPITPLYAPRDVQLSDPDKASFRKRATWASLFRRDARRLFERKIYFALRHGWPVDYRYQREREEGREEGFRSLFRGKIMIITAY